MATICVEGNDKNWNEISSQNFVPTIFQVTMTCSKSILETLEKGVNIFEVNSKNTRTK